jgi:hypothetical protein
MSFENLTEAREPNCCPWSLLYSFEFNQHTFVILVENYSYQVAGIANSNPNSNSSAKLTQNIISVDFDDYLAIWIDSRHHFHLSLYHYVGY